MEWHLRPFIAGTWVAGLLIGLSFVSTAALAEARQVGGNKAVWDKACQKNSNCMPVGDIGGGINGYFVHDGKGGGTSVYCDDNNCAADREIRPTKDAVQILQQPASEIGGAIGSKAATGKESPAMLLNMH
ncbi:MAG TPA: hypothetical protein VJ822_08280 [Dongiaceae bacterium]|nr:hypothetical protein [Dongiaceae bacterium]